MNSDNKNAGIKRSCWYYDNQMLDRMTSMSLHANTFRDGSGSWIQYKPGQPGIDKGGYSLTPLCTSILSDDFQVTLANTWSGDSGSDPAGAIWDQLKPLAPLTDFVRKALVTVGNKAREWRQASGNDGGLTGLIAKGAEKVGDFAKGWGSNAIDYMNARLISQGTRFTYYGGTGVSFGNLQMRFTIFPIWTHAGNFLTVQQQLENLFPYVIGEYRPFEIEKKTKKDKETGETITQTYGSGLLGWQMSPAGYRANLRDIDVAGMRGTLKIRMGASYVLESLLCENLSFSLSKQMVKKPDNASYYGMTEMANQLKDYKQHVFSPLFCDVVMSFHAATKYSDRAMRHFIYGINLGRPGLSDTTNEGANHLDSEMRTSLEAIKKNLDDVY